MLILTRRQNQSIKLGSEITLRILAIKGGQVRVGIDAPRDVAVYREELAKRIGQRAESAVDRYKSAPIRAGLSKDSISGDDLVAS